MPTSFSCPSTSNSEKMYSPKPTQLNEEDFKRIIETCKAEDSYSKLVHTLGHVFSNPELLGQSFVGPGATLPVSQSQLSKEQLRSMEDDLDKDKDCQEMSMEERVTDDTNDRITVDVEAIRRSFQALSTVGSQKFESPLIHALILLSETLELDLKYGKNKPEVNLGNVFVIAFELPWLGTGEYFENALPALCRACALLPLNKQASLVRFWAVHGVSNLRDWVQTLQQLISFRVLSGDFGRDYAVNEDDTITACVKVIIRMLDGLNLILHCPLFHLLSCRS